MADQNKNPITVKEGYQPTLDKGYQPKLEINGHQPQAIGDARPQPPKSHSGVPATSPVNSKK